MGARIVEGPAVFSRRLWLVVLGSLLLLPSCGDGGPTGPDTSNLEIRLVQGDGQAAQPGSSLAGRLEVRVQKRGSGTPVEGAKVLWEISGSLGGTLNPPVSHTDSLGLASSLFTLGPTLGTYRVQASLRGTESPPVEFSVQAVLAPGISELPSGPVQAGDTILIRGSDFHPDPIQNVVTFSGVRGRVVSATSAELLVEVPPCLSARDYQVRARIGFLTTDPASLEVVGDPWTLFLEAGEDRVLDASEGFNCVHLPSGRGAVYLVVPHSTGTVGGAEHGFSLAALTADGLSPVPAQPRIFAGGGWEPLGVPSPRGGLGEELALEAMLDAQDRLDERLRALEAEVLAVEASSLSPEGPGVSEPRSPSRLPELGDKRVFKVLKPDDKFAKVTARIRFVSEHTLVYVDEVVPGGGFTDGEFAALALEFEDPVYPTITGAFGPESDLDENGRVIILFTPAVNRLTAPGSDGFVGGFFFGLDLLEGRDGSNGGEIFYALVPDPAGEEGPIISKYTALNAIPAVLAHEFEHMVHFNRRMLLKGADVQEALWLSEGLAQMAEDLVGEAFDEAGIPSKAYQYRAGNWIRARRYLADPSQVSVLASLSPGTLAQRGAGWLLLKQVLGRPGQEDLLSELVSSVSSGTENLTESTGLGWKELVADWAGALFLDGMGVAVRPELSVSGVNLRNALADSDGSYPLKGWEFGGQSALFSGTLWSSAPNYFIIRPPPGGGVALGASGPMGGLPEASMGLQVLVVRLQ